MGWFMFYVLHIISSKTSVGVSVQLRYYILDTANCQ